MKPENKLTQAIHVQSHDWTAENQQLRKELLSREKRIEELEGYGFNPEQPAIRKDRPNKRHDAEDDLLYDNQ